MLFCWLSLLTASGSPPPPFATKFLPRDLAPPHLFSAVLYRQLAKGGGEFSFPSINICRYKYKFSTRSTFSASRQTRKNGRKVFTQSNRRLSLSLSVAGNQLAIGTRLISKQKQTSREGSEFMKKKEKRRESNLNVIGRTEKSRGHISDAKEKRRPYLQTAPS